MTRYATAFAGAEATYRSVDLAGRTGGEDAAGLVGLLYAEASRALRSAAWAAANGRYDLKSERVTRALVILFALENGLDFENGGDVSRTLSRVYRGARTEVVDASLGSDPAPFLSVATTLDEIAGAWAAARGR
ncbi:flagellar protein FliS [Sphingomonas sp. RS2018]